MTKTTFEEGTAALESITMAERAPLDGDQARDELRAVLSPAEAAYQFVVSDPSRLNEHGYYELLRPKDEPAQFGSLNSLLAGRVVIRPVRAREGLRLFPAVISIDGLTNPGVMKFHILTDEYLPTGLTEDQQILLSGAAQGEAESVGQHGRAANDSVETEHLLGLLSRGQTKQGLASWRNSPVHQNHLWRQKGGSVMGEISRPGQAIPSIMPHQILTHSIRQADSLYTSVLWHESILMAAGDTPQALKMIQGIGFLIAKDHDPDIVNTVKEELAA